MKRFPKSLRPGDKVRLVAPASPVTREMIARGVTILQDEGYEVEFGRHLFDRDGYLAGSDRDRAADLSEAFADPEVACVYCARGGYGTARIMPFLDLDALASSRKMFVGFSDVTTLHLALNRRGLPTLQAPMPITLGTEREPWVVESLVRCLRGEFGRPEGAPRAQTLVGGVAEGELVGGCLCLLTDSLGTNERLETEGKILLIEDVDEHPHRIDAMLTHLRTMGLLQACAGIAIGEMTRSDELGDPSIGAWPWRRIVEDRVGDLGVPTIVELPFGHMKNMLSFPLGVEGRLDADAGTLDVVEPAFVD